MLGNVNVCLHTWPGNAGMNYEMGGTILRKTVEGKILRPMGNNGCTGVARIFVWGGGDSADATQPCISRANV